MGKIAKELSAIEVKRLSEPGLHPVGVVPGLRLNIKPSGAKSWILRTTVGAKRSDIGLGAYPAVTLAAAWERARKTLADIREGKDPVADRQAKRAARDWTFENCALAYIAAFEPSWKNQKHGQQWRNTLETYVYPHFGDKHVKDVDTADVMAAIGPSWSTKNETMVRVRNRIELVLSWAAAQGHRPRGFNPATWRGHLDQVLPRPSKVNKREHFEAMPLDAVHGFYTRLQGVHGMSSKCLQFAILTACRSGEARKATWVEMDLNSCVWSIPAERMKSGRPHRVPLSQPVVELLKALPRFEGSDLVFPGRDVEKPLSDMALTLVMRRMNLTAVPHGFRSSFSDWVSERTAYPGEVREMALAHAVGNATEAAYRRGDLFEKRRNLMNDWAQFVTEPPASGDNVVPLRAA